MNRLIFTFLLLHFQSPQVPTTSMYPQNYQGPPSMSHPYTGNFANNAINCNINGQSSFMNLYKFTHADLNRKMDLSTPTVVKLIAQYNSTNSTTNSVNHTVILAIDNNSQMTYIGYKIAVSPDNTGNNIGGAEFLEFIETHSLPLMQKIYKDSFINWNTTLPCTDIKAEFSAYSQDAYGKLRYQYAGADRNFASSQSTLTINLNIPNCRTGDQSTGGCRVCSPGYYVNGLNCVQQQVSNCVRYVENVNECAFCSPSYGVVGGKCEQKVVNCQNNNNNNCRCPMGYIVQANYCVISSVRFCAVNNPEVPNTCSLCQPGYILASTPLTLAAYLATRFQTPASFCVFPVAQCTNYDPSTLKCTSCKLGYSLNGDAECKPSGSFRPMVLGMCGDTYVFDPNSGLCKRQTNDINCLVVQGNNCVQCFFGYALTSNDNCAVLPSSNICLFMASNLDSFACLFCQNGYFLNAGFNCVLNNIRNCAVQTINGCQVCSSGSTLNAGTCV